MVKKYFHTLLVLLISSQIVSCAHKSDKVGVLEKRSKFSLQNENTNVAPPIVRTQSTVKKAWLHKHEMPTGDYFGGAWIYLLVEKNKWNFSKSN